MPANITNCPDAIPVFPDAFSVSGLAEDLGCSREVINHYVRTLGVRIMRVRRGRRKNLGCLSHEDAVRITKAYFAAETAAREVAAATHPHPLPLPQNAVPTPPAPASTTTRNLKPETRNSPASNGWGYFYLIQLEPEQDPGRYKLGFSTDPDQRLATFQTIAPHAICLARWPAHRTWECTAIAAVTQDSDCVRHEVFHANDLAAVRAAADRIFACLPKPPFMAAAPFDPTDPPNPSSCSRATAPPTCPAGSHSNVPASHTGSPRGACIQHAGDRGFQPGVPRAVALGPVEHRARLPGPPAAWKAAPQPPGPHEPS